jgi:hypothetical protein
LARRSATLLFRSIPQCEQYPRHFELLALAPSNFLCLAKTYKLDAHQHPSLKFRQEDNMMPLPRLLLLCLFGLTCAASAAAQSPAVNLSPSQPNANSPLHVPPLTHIPALIESAPGTTQATQFHMPQQLTLAPQNELQKRLELQKQLTLAQNDQPCYAMRSYGFSADDLKSSDPRPSSYSTCAPTSSVRLKSAATVNSK